MRSIWSSMWISGDDDYAGAVVDSRTAGIADGYGWAEVGVTSYAEYPGPYVSSGDAPKYDSVSDVMSGSGEGEGGVNGIGINNSKSCGSNGSPCYDGRILS